MPPHNITDTQIYEIKYYEEEIIPIKPKLSVYEQLLPRNEHKLLTFLRGWERQMGFITPLKWKNLIFLSLLHIITLLWCIYNFSQGWLPKWQTVAFYFFWATLGGFGVTGGVHRYYTHRSYKAKLPMKLFLLYCYTIAGQNTVFEWVRDHRLHHKHSDTDADPHNSKRGLFFSHVGWLMMKKHPKVLEEGAKIDMRDIVDDPLERFHAKHFVLLQIILVFVLPALIPVYGWSESWNYSILSQPFFRYMAILNCTWSVNSLAHAFGNKPYDGNIVPSENRLVSLLALGEGWHNYHHTFPWDYKTAELPFFINLTTILLNTFLKIGWVYDAKVASPALIKATVLRKSKSTPPGS